MGENRTHRKCIIRELAERRGVSSLSPRSPREEAGPLKGSPVSVRLRPGVRPELPGPPAPAHGPRPTSRSATGRRPVADLVAMRPVAAKRIKRAKSVTNPFPVRLMNCICARTCHRNGIRTITPGLHAMFPGPRRPGPPRNDQPLASGPARVMVILTITRRSRRMASRYSSQSGCSPEIRR